MSTNWNPNKLKYTRKTNPTKLVCFKCGTTFAGHWNKVYCGDSKKKIGCAYKRHLEYNAQYNKDHLEKQKSYVERWRKTEKGKESMRQASKRHKLKKRYDKTPTPPHRV